MSVGMIPVLSHCYPDLSGSPLPPVDFWLGQPHFCSPFFKNAGSSYKILLLLNKSGPYEVLLFPRSCSGEKFVEWPSRAGLPPMRCGEEPVLKE